MKYSQESWRIQKWTKEPSRGARFEIIKDVHDYKKIQDLSFMENMRLGWYTITWQRREKTTGYFAPHVIESAYHKYRDPETGRIKVELWRGRFGNWEKTDCYKYFS